MQPSHILDSLKSIELPPCPKCKNPMWLARIEPAANSDDDERTFECPRCQHSETIIVKFK